MTTIYIKNDVLNRLSIPDVKLYIVHLIFKVFCRRLCCVEISRFARNDTGSASVISTGGRDLRSTVVFRRRQKAQYVAVLGIHPRKALLSPQTRGWGLICIMLACAACLSGCIDWDKFWEGQSELDVGFLESFKPADAGPSAGSSGSSRVREVGNTGPSVGNAGTIGNAGQGGAIGTIGNAGQGGDTGTVGPTGQGGAIGTVGNAGQGDDTGTQLGACQNTADQAIFNAVDVAAEVETCATDCALKTDVNTCTSQCVVTATGLSSACAGCYGAVTACMIDNCLNVCINRNSPLCLSCQDRYCTSAFNTCTGLSK
jgi:hypothetical protein